MWRQGVITGEHHTVVCTDEGQAYSFGFGEYGRLGHGGDEHELVPRLIEAAVAGYERTVVRTDEGKA